MSSSSIASAIDRVGPEQPAERTGPCPEPRGHRLKTAVWSSALIIRAGIGAIYGLLALEAVSPLAIVLLLWVLGILVIAWRVPLQVLVIAASAGGFVLAFGGTRRVRLGRG